MRIGHWLSSFLSAFLLAGLLVAGVLALISTTPALHQPAPAAPAPLVQEAATTPTARSIAYAYDGAGRLTSVDYGDGVVIRYTYDAAGNLTASEVEAGGEALFLPLIVK
jgi:YD repeat-containing protein